MKTAIFTAYWQGRFRPIMVAQGACVTLDTGRVSVGEHWQRCMASFEFDGETVTMTRLTESADNDNYQSSHGSWTCPLGQLNAEIREIGNLAIPIPDWTAVSAQVYRQAADTKTNQQASA